MRNEPQKAGRYTVTIDDNTIHSKIIEKILAIPSISFESGAASLAEAPNLQPEAVFLDIHLGNESGLSIIPQLREHWPTCPFIVITASAEESAISEALEAGADDFIQKPLKPNELEARFKARIKDAKRKQSNDTFTIDSVVVDRLKRTVKCNQALKYVTPTDIAILSVLHKHSGQVVKRDELKEQIWGHTKVTDNALNRKLHEVRNVLKSLTQNINIRTIYGVGFSLEIKQDT